MNVIESLSTDDYALIGRVLTAQGRHTQGLAFLDEYHRRNPMDVDCLLGMSTALINLKRTNEARHILRQVLISDPQNAVAWLNMGSACYTAGEFEAARQAYETGQAIQSPVKNSFWCSMGSTSHFLGDIQRSIDEYRSGLQANPYDYTSEYSLGMMLMSVSQCRAGLRHYEARLKLRPVFPLPESDVPIWDPSERHAERILVVAEQGIGDVFMFARYAAHFKQQDSRLRFTLFVPDALVGIMERWPGYDAIAPASEQVIPKCDAQIAIGSLPLAWLKTTGEAITLPVGPDITGSPLNSKRIGVCWRGNPMHSNDRYRSIPLHQLTPILDSSHSWEWTSFQKDMTSIEAVEFVHAARMDSWEDTLREMGHLRLLITADTSVAHLAGSLRIPVWLLLPAACDWRWGNNGESTPWYPSMRIFRQQKLGDWSPVVERVIEALREVQ